jgi:hypothetical protein
MFIVFTHVHQLQLFWYVVTKKCYNCKKIAFAIFNWNQVEKIVPNGRYFSNDSWVTYIVFKHDGQQTSKS